MHETIRHAANSNCKQRSRPYRSTEVCADTSECMNILLDPLEKQLLLACSRDDTLKLIELRENRVIQTFR